MQSFAKQSTAEHSFAELGKKKEIFLQQPSQARLGYFFFNKGGKDVLHSLATARLFFF